MYHTQTHNYVQIEESAKKPVEATSSGSDVLRLYNKWYEKVEPTEGTKEKGLFQKVKKAIKDRTVSLLYPNPLMSICLCSENIVLYLLSKVLRSPILVGHKLAQFWLFYNFSDLCRAVHMTWLIQVPPCQSLRKIW